MKSSRKFQKWVGFLMVLIAVFSMHVPGVSAKERMDENLPTGGVNKIEVLRRK